MTFSINKKIVGATIGGIVGSAVLGATAIWAYNEGVFESTAKIDPPWVLAGTTSDDSAKWYIEYTTVERSGRGVVTAWVMGNIIKPQKDNIRSVKAMISFGCETNKYLIHTATSYSKQAGLGEIVSQDDNGRVADIIPGSVFSVVKTAACTFQDYKENRAQPTEEKEPI